MREMRRVMENIKTPDNVMTLLLNGLHAVLYDQNPNTISIPQGLDELATSQRLIGWHHLLTGRLSMDWQRHVQAHLVSTNQVTSKRTGATWAVNVIAALFQQWLSLWKLRNEDRHGRDSTSRAEASRRQAIREIELLYNKYDQVLPSYRWILEEPLEEKLNWTTNLMRAWISNFKPILEKGYTTELETG